MFIKVSSATNLGLETIGVDVETIKGELDNG